MKLRCGAFSIWKAGFRRVIVESDSLMLVNLIIADSPTNHPLFNIIHECRSLLKGNWNCKVQHVYRESNMVADRLAYLGHSLEMGTTVFEAPPLQISDCLDYDLSGAVSSRIVPSL